jgi:hypothetical protein
MRRIKVEVFRALIRVAFPRQIELPVQYCSKLTRQDYGAYAVSVNILFADMYACENAEAFRLG